MFTKDSVKEDVKKIAEEAGRDIPKPGEKYKHFKGHVIEVIALATHTETEESLVVYKCESNDLICARPLKMFFEKVDKEKYPNADQENRFEKIG